VRTTTLETSIRSAGGTASGVKGKRIAQRARTAGAAASLTPEDVAKVVVRTAAARPPLRRRAGMQARGASLLKRWLPPRLFEAFIIRQFVKPLLPPAHTRQVRGWSLRWKRE